MNSELCMTMGLVLGRPVDDHIRKQLCPRHSLNTLPILLKMTKHLEAAQNKKNIQKHEVTFEKPLDNILMIAFEDENIDSRVIRNDRDFS